MVSEMEDDHVEDMEVEVLSSMWPEDIDEAGKKFNVEKPGLHEDMLEDLAFIEEPSIVDFKRLVELTSYSEKGSSQLAYLVKNWEYKQENAVRLLREELENLSKQQHEVQLKKLEIFEQHRFEESYEGDKRPVSVLDGVYEIFQDVPKKRNDVIVEDKRVEIDAEYDTVIYWKQKALHLGKLLEESVQREHILLEKLEESIENLEKQSSPVEELSQILKRADNFLHFVLQNAPVVIGHQDNELRYRFIYNHFPSLREEDIIGKTDVEIFKGGGVKESQDFKREVLEKGLPGKREITFETELFGAKTFLIYVEPVFSKDGEKIGVNYMGMEITDQVKKREKMAKLREEIAVQKAKETELNKTIHITEETMRAKQMLATMSHEIRSPLSGVVSMAEILSTTKLDKDQKQLLGVMLSSGDLVLQLINDILDLSKVESGVMKLEATKFRPREVIKHVLQTAAASLKKMLILEGHVADDVPLEIIGDVLRIRQILTNLISNAIKFTHQGKVEINLYVIADPYPEGQQEPKNINTDDSSIPTKSDLLLNGHEENEPQSHETVVWIRCDIKDTGIGIPETALPNLFKKYMQAGADTARKYGGTGLGLAICKQLVELMGGHLTVSSKEHCGSTFTFILPHKLSHPCDGSDDTDEFGDMADNDESEDEDITCGFFQFKPHTLGSVFSSKDRISVLPENLYSIPSSKVALKEINSMDDDSSCFDTSSEPESCSKCNSENENTASIVVASCSPSSKTDLCDTWEARKDSNRSSECSSSVGNQEDVGNGRSTRKPKILLVEDHMVNVMVARRMMRQLNQDMDVVNNGAEAVRAVQNCPYDLILMDVCMPVMDGLEATRLIRSYEKTGNWDEARKAGVEPEPHDHDHDSPFHNQISRKRIPIVAMTANAMSESGEECFENGMDSFITKPVTLQNLKQCLEQYVE
ncbi:histidine kinase 5 [Lactuca sativa]|uniref:histidine kinase 5 n=1 Tax=Lactuca sativa TaxID=4236 RepID=UPI000CD85F2E|nr:histidine kinase 5 [Lactuca sativa]XP_023768625.1 histidine kinase 5 [Lactuca sativa]XP_023768626.1 histidine kinase 5 [Lactuca sativa]XP_042755981.1 histidine kinase 5 [Lactuca sativa]